MPSFAGFFGRKNKPNNNNSSHETDSALSSPVTDYVTPDRSLPSSPNGKSSLNRDQHSSTSRLKLPFGRKKTAATASAGAAAASASSTSVVTSYAASQDSNYNALPRPPYLYTSSPRTSSSSVVSDTDHDSRRLRPPPSKSAIFAAYGDPNSALSTRSLPNGSTTSPLTITTAPPLPNSNSYSSTPPPVPPKNSKKPGFFQWSRSTPTSPQSSFSSYPPQQQQQQQPWQLSPISPTKSDLSDSFNLKAFRHVGGASTQGQGQTTSPPNASNTSLPPPPTPSASVPAAVPRPRPRGMSTNSDSSQRISVAAFREAQARRSTAGSPVPPPSSGRDPSPGLYAGTGARGQAQASQPPSSHAHTHAYSPGGGGGGVPQGKGRQRNKRSSMLAYDSDSDEDESEEDESEEDEEGRRGRDDNVSRRQMVTKRSFHQQRESPTKSVGRATKSEVGHGASSTAASATTRRETNFKPGPRSLSSHILTSQYPGPNSSGGGNGQQKGDGQEQPERYPRSQSSLGVHSYGGQARPRASVSTSALTPTGAAKRASVLAAANTGKPDLPANTKRHSRAISAHNVSNTSTEPTHVRRPANTYASSSSDSSSDDDDAPLATLVPPRRPGSALSSHNGSHSSLRSTATAAAPKPLIDINELTNGRPKPVNVRGSSLNVNVGTMEGFTGGGTLLGRTLASGGNVGAGVGNSTVQTSVDPPTKFVSPPSSPVMEVKQIKEEIVRLPHLPSPPSQLQQQQQEETRSAPLRRETSPEAGLGAGRKDALGERLARVVQMRSVGLEKGSGGTTSASTSTSTAATTPSASAVSAPTQIKPIMTTTTTRPFATVTTTTKDSPVSADEDLASLLGAGVHLIRRTSDSDSDSETKTKTRAQNAKVAASDDESGSSSGSGSDSDSDSEDGYTKIKKGKGKKERDSLTPIPIKERAPPPAFSVTSRPPLKRHEGGDIGEGGDRTSVASTNALSHGQTQQTKRTAATETTTMYTKVTMTTARQRSTTLVPSSSSSALETSSSTRPGILNSKATSPTHAGFAPRQRSSTLLPNSISTPPPTTATTTTTIAASTTTTSGSSSSSSSAYSASASASTSNKNHKTKAVPPMVSPPSRPFAAGRRDSPASSTGDSSSGRAPFTPKDGSEVGVGHSRGVGAGAGEWGGGVSGLPVKGVPRYAKRRSVSFGDELEDVKTSGKGKAGKEREKEPEVDVEERRRERRRGEAKAAIELGNVINGRGPVMDDDDDDDRPINQTLAGGGRMSTLNPMMAMGGGPAMGGGMPMGFGPGVAASPGWNMNMNMNMNPNMLSPAQFMPPGAAGADPNFMVAHQQAMMYAKQAYQMAVAQQAMAAAGDEWERGSTIGGFGSGGSVYGGPSPSIVGSPFGMSPMMNMNMGMGMGMQSPGAGWSSGGSVIFPASSRSMYGGISGARSEYGGGGGGGRGGGQWSSSKSSYGESFGRTTNNRSSKAGWSRESGYFPPVPPLPQHASGSPSSKVDSSPRSRTTSQPANPGRGVRKIPPSSWKASGA